MKRKRETYLILTILFFSFLSSVYVLPAFAQPSISFKVTRVVWGTDPDSPTKAYPGDMEMPLTVEVQNLSPNETIKGVTATLMLADGPFADIYGKSNATATGEPVIGDILNPTDEILPKSFFTLTFSLDIAENTLPRAYTYSMLVEYSANGSGLFLEGEPKILTVEFIVSTIESTVTCSVSPESVEKGDLLEVSGSVDPVLENLSVTLLYKKPDGSTFNTTVKTNVDGSYKNSFIVDTEGSWSVNASWVGDEKHEGDWISVPFEVRFPVSLRVIKSDSRLVAGLDNPFNVTLLNDGEVAVSDIDVTLSIPSPLVIQGDNQFTFEYIPPGDTALISVEIYAPESSIGATYSGTISINYQDDYGESYSRDYPLGMIIRGQIELLVYGKTFNPQPARPGLTVSITATILNKGNTAARYVNASILPNAVLGLTSESTVYIGEVEENAPSPFTLTSIVNNNTQDGTFPFVVSITYKDDQYVDHSLNVTFNLVVEKANEGQNGSQDTSGFLGPYSESALILLILLGASVIIILLYRRHLSKQPREIKKVQGKQG
jgi:hypothetical protein